MWDELELLSLEKIFKKNEIAIHELLTPEELDCIAYGKMESVALANLTTGLKFNPKITESTWVRKKYESSNTFVATNINCSTTGDIGFQLWSFRGINFSIDFGTIFYKHHI